MSEVGSYKWIEVLLLVAAGVGFYVWQRRDLRRAAEATRAERERQQARQVQRVEHAPPGPPAPTAPNPPPARQEGPALPP
jgi:hypothetical protein